MDDARLNENEGDRVRSRPPRYSPSRKPGPTGTPGMLSVCKHGRPYLPDWWKSAPQMARTEEHTRGWGLF